MGACINSILDDCSFQIVYQFLVISAHFRCGESLAHVFSSPEVQSYLFGESGPSREWQGDISAGNSEEGVHAVILLGKGYY